MKKIKYTILLLTIVSFMFGQEKGTSNQNPENAPLFTQPRFFTDTIWINDSSLWQYKTDNMFVNMQKSITMSYDQQGRKTSVLWMNWNQQQQSWYNKSYDSVTFYNATGNIIEKFGYVRNTNGNNWAMTSSLKYTENGNLTQQIIKTWDNMSNKYTGGYRQSYEYNDQELPTTYFWDDFDSNMQDFVPGKRRKYFYDGFNRDTTMMMEKWNLENQTWKSYYKSEMTYNEQGFLQQQTDFKWSVDSAEWINSIKFIYSFNSNGLKDTLSQFTWLKDYFIWFPTNRYIYTYDDKGRVIESIRQEGSPGGDDLVNAGRGLNIYENDRLVKTQVQNWGSGAWQDDYIKLFTYVSDTIMESSTMIFYDPYNHVYDTTTRWMTEFNDQFLPVRSLYQNYDKTTSDFTTTMQILYYWSPLVITDAINEKEPFSLLIYPNPSTDQLNIRSDEEIKHIELLNYIGQQILFKNDTGKQFSINTSSLEPGIYIVRVKTEKGVVDKKVVISR